MIKRELAKDPKLADQSWDRFLPKLPKKSLSKRRKPHVIHEKKNKSLFPPPQQPRKIDLQIESGEYFLKGWEKKAKEISAGCAISAANRRPAAKCARS